jgi:hypothetical protein
VISLSDGEVVEDRRIAGVHDAPPVLHHLKSAHHPVESAVAQAQAQVQS